MSMDNLKTARQKIVNLDRRCHGGTITLISHHVRVLTPMQHVDCMASSEVINCKVDPLKLKP